MIFLNFVLLYCALLLRAELVLVERIEYNDLVESVQGSMDSSDIHNNEPSNGNEDAETKPGNSLIIGMSEVIILLSGSLGSPASSDQLLVSNLNGAKFSHSKMMHIETC